MNAIMSWKKKGRMTHLCRGLRIPNEKSSDKNSQGGQALESNVHGYIHSFKACQCKCDICIVEQRERKQPLRSLPIHAPSICDFQHLPNVDQDGSSHLLFEKDKGKDN
jgi:hypothetical protein